MSAENPLPIWPVDYVGPRLLSAELRESLQRDPSQPLEFETVPQVEQFCLFTYLWPTPGLDPQSLAGSNPLQQQYLLGAQVMYRQEWHLVGHARGELLYSLPLSPGEETTVEVLSWDRNIYKREQEFSSDLEREISENHSYKDSREVLREIKRTKKWYASGKGSVNIFNMVKVNADPGGVSRETEEIDRSSRQTIVESTDSASTRLHNQHKTSISATREYGREDRVTRKLSNTNRCHPVTYHFYEVLRNYAVLTKAATPAARPCIFVKQVPPIQRGELLVEPYDYHAFLKALRWMHQHSHLIAEGLLDRSFYQGLEVLPELVAYWSLRRGLAASANFDSELLQIASVLVAGATMVRAHAPPDFRMQLLLLHQQIDDHAPWLFDSILDDGDSLQAAISSGTDGAVTQAVDRLLSQFAQYYPNSPQHFRDMFESALLQNHMYQPLIGLRNLFSKLVYGPQPGEDPQPAHLELMTKVGEAQRLMRHIEKNHLHYFQVIWAADDPGLRLLEASDTLLPWGDNLRLADVIEPTPLGFYADYAVFPYTQADADSMLAELVQSFLDRATEPAQESEAVLPTNGIVVEAQLSDSCACEPFIRSHREHDLALKSEEVEQSRLESQRRRRKLDHAELDNPTCCPSPRYGLMHRLWHCLCGRHRD